MDIKYIATTDRSHCSRVASDVVIHNVSASTMKSLSSSSLSVPIDAMKIAYDDLVQQITPKMEKRNCRNKKITFPIRLYLIVQLASEFGFHHIISWEDHGSSIYIHDKDIFIQLFATSYFGFKTFPSFQRQLNLYGFSHIASTNGHGVYHHNKFRRGQLALCLTMTRERATKGKKSNTASPHHSPKQQGINDFDIDVSNQMHGGGGASMGLDTFPTFRNANQGHDHESCIKLKDNTRNMFPQDKTHVTEKHVASGRKEMFNGCSHRFKDDIRSNDSPDSSTACLYPNMMYKSEISPSIACIPTLGQPYRSQVSRMPQYSTDNDFTRYYHPGSMNMKKMYYNDDVDDMMLDNEITNLTIKQALLFHDMKQQQQQQQRQYQQWQSTRIEPLLCPMTTIITKTQFSPKQTIHHIPYTKPYDDTNHNNNNNINNSTATTLYNTTLLCQNEHIDTMKPTTTATTSGTTTGTSSDLIMEHPMDDIIDIDLSHPFDWKSSSIVEDLKINTTAATTATKNNNTAIRIIPSTDDIVVSSSLPTSTSSSSLLLNVSNDETNVVPNRKNNIMDDDDDSDDDIDINNILDDECTMTLINDDEDDDDDDEEFCGKLFHSIQYDRDDISVETIVTTVSLDL